MNKIKRAIAALCGLFIIALPFQTHWLYDRATINGQPWQYGELRLYATEFLLAAIFCLAIFYLAPAARQGWRASNTLNWKHRAIKFAPLAPLALAIFLNIYFSINRNLSVYRWEILIGGLTFFFVLKLFCYKEQIFSALATSGALQSLFALQQFFSQKISANKWLGMAAQDPAILGTPVIEAADSRWLRAFGALSHPNAIGGFLVFALLATIYLLAKTKKTKYRYILFIGAALNFAGLITTFSRGAWCAFIVGLVALAIAQRKQRAAVVFEEIPRRETKSKNPLPKLLLILILIATVFVLAFPNLFLARADLTNRLEIKSTNERVEQYSTWFNIIKRHWFFGVGAGNYTVALAESTPGLENWSYQPIHNTFLLTFAELGAIAIILLTATFYLLRKNFRINIKQNLPWLFAILIIGLFDHYLWSSYVGAMLSSILFTNLVETRQCHVSTFIYTNYENQHKIVGCE